MKNNFLVYLILLMSSACTSLSNQDQALFDSQSKELLERYYDWVSKMPKDKRKVAIFDFDNTLIKNDIGDVSVFYLIDHEKIFTPFNQEHQVDFSILSPLLTEEAIEILNSVCATQDTFLPTKKNKECGNKLLSTYLEGKMTWSKSGVENNIDVWKKHETEKLKDTLEPGYALAASFFSGHSIGEVKRMASEFIKESNKAAIGSKKEVAGISVDAYTRPYTAMKGLVKKLQNLGLEVWVVTASPEAVVQVYAREFGIDEKHVLGVRTYSGVATDSTKLTYQFAECGPYNFGKPQIMTYRQGKRCFINKFIFNEQDPGIQMNQESPLLFSAGDSNTDSFFVKDSLGIKVVINRNKDELMCMALQPGQSDFPINDHKWGKYIIQPMFIGPKKLRSDPYSCKKFGLVDVSELTP